MQDIFVTLWENRNKTRIKTSLRNYLAISVKNQCLKHKQLYLNTLPYENNREVMEDEIYLQKEIALLLNEALQRLLKEYLSD